MCTERRVSTTSAYTLGESGFHVTQTENHWSNEIVHLVYLKKTIIPHIEKVRKQLNLKVNQNVILIYVFKGATTGAVSELLEKKNIISKVSANKTDLFQQLDLSVNKSSKCFLSNKYQTWYVDQIAAQLGRGVAPHDVKVDVKQFGCKAITWEMVVVCSSALKRKLSRMGFEKATPRKRMIRP